MTRYRIEVRPGVERWFRKLRDERLKVRLTEAMARLADNPRPVGALKLHGAEARYRLRVGDYRIIYEIHDRLLVVLIVDVADRKDVYRRN